MNYFDNIPLLTINGYTTKDITRRAHISNLIKNKADFFYFYNVKDGEKIEDVAYNHYEDAGLHWLVMLMNDIVDPFYDWVLSNKELDAYIAAKYTDPEATHHWLLNGVIYNHNVQGSVAISNRQFEIDENEKKRKIQLVRPDYINQILREIKTLLL